MRLLNRLKVSPRVHSEYSALIIVTGSPLNGSMISMISSPTEHMMIAQTEYLFLISSSRSLILLGSLGDTEVWLTGVDVPLAAPTGDLGFGIGVNSILSSSATCFLVVSDVKSSPSITLPRALGHNHGSDARPPVVKLSLVG